MKSIDFKKIFLKIKAPKRKEFRTISSKAHHDWKFILISFFILSTLVVSLNTYIFFEISKGEIFVKEIESGLGSEVISEKNLENAVRFFEERQIRFDRLQIEKPVIPDPSL